MVTNEHLQSIIDGDIGIIDSTQAVAVARELLAARTFLEAYEHDDYHAEIAAFKEARKAAE